MNFFGGPHCGGDIGRDDHDIRHNDCCSLIFLLLLLQNCGGCGGFKGGEITIDCGTILLLILLSNCGFGCK